MKSPPANPDNLSQRGVRTIRSAGKRTGQGTTLVGGSKRLNFYVLAKRLLAKDPVYRTNLFCWEAKMESIFLLFKWTSFSCLALCNLASVELGACQSPEPAAPVAATTADQVSFNQHIAPIIFEKCAGCHRPGQAGPFELLSYEDVAKRAKTIEAVIDSKYMPPWKPVNKEISYVGDRRLSDEEIQLFKGWVASGKPRGSGQGPSAPKFPDGWALGAPDLVLQMNGRYVVPASGPDIYRSFVFPAQLDEDKWVRAIEFRPSARSSVHHALFFVDPEGNARSLDGADGQPGIEGMGFLAVGSAAGGEASLRGLTRVRQTASGAVPTFDLQSRFTRSLGGYAPGVTPVVLPADLALKLPKGSDIVMQTHFHPSGKEEVEQGQLAIYFSDEEPTRTIVPIQVPAMFGFGTLMRIPAGETNYVVRESFTVPVDIELVNIGAHAHYVCREVSMTAKLPDGKSLTLLEIDDWDLDWQDRYTFDQRIVLPAGTVLTTELVYDNSASNPENPNSPPQALRWGRESGDEMGSASVMAVAVNSSEHEQLMTGLQRFMLQSLTRHDMIDLMMQLDTNRDGGLQASEAPPRMAGRFKLIDRNRDGKLDRSELEFIRAFLPGGNGGGNRK